MQGNAHADGLARLGASRVMVIDEDLGRSAANAAERPGFARLVAELTMGHVGLVLGLEMSRLARAGQDWHQLTGAVLAGRTLLADAVAGGAAIELRQPVPMAGFSGAAAICPSRSESCSNIPLIRAGSKRSRL